MSVQKFRILRLATLLETENLLRVSRLDKSYDGFQAVKSVSFDIRKGEIFGLLGPNGAGKTSTISIIAGLIPHSGGEVFIDGVPSTENSLGTRSKVGLVPQELAIYPKLSGYENLEFFGRLYGLKKQDLSQRISEMLSLVGLSDRAKDLSTNYSGGMKRRLNLAIGLMHRPQLLLLDEPTVGVDPQSRNHIFEGVKELNRKGLTVLYTSHYMEEVEALCDRVGIMDGGVLVACDTISNLVAKMGGSVIEIGIEGDSLLPGVLEALKTQSNVNALELIDTSPADLPKAASLLRLRTDRPSHALPEIVSTLTSLNQTFQSLSIKEPNLEDVFLSLTGKSLRD